MYVSFFGLAHAPFSIAPDPRYLFMSERHREALAHLLYGLDAGGGFVVLSGEIGAGKTTVCHCFLEQVPATCHLAYIFNPKLTVIELLQSVCDEFGIAVTPAAPGAPTVKDYLDPLNRFLLEAHAKGRQCVLVIDEAQNLSARVLEQLRLLTNLETRERKLLQIILIGQPELRRLLARPELEQLAQRVIARFHLGALSESETARYISHRLAVAGRSGAVPFDRAALQRIHRLTGGVPRRINLLCDRALLGAYVEGRHTVSRRIVDRAATEVFGNDRAPRRRPSPWALALAALAGAGVLAAAGLLAWQVQRGRTTPSPPAPASAPSAGRAANVPASAPASGAAVSLPVPAAVGSAASGAAVPASATHAAGPSPATRSWPAFDPATDLGLLPHDERALWRELAAAWSVEPPVGDPCSAGAKYPLHCFRSGSTTLALIRQFDRPGLVTLSDAQGRPVHARLVGLDAQSARLATGSYQWTLPLEELAGLWRGDFATFWRPPEGYTKPLGEGATGPAVQALAAGLARQRDEPPPAAGAVLDAALRARLAAFQLVQGLKPDGLAGPTTFMLLNRALGVAEPRLSAE